MFKILPDYFQYAGLKCFFGFHDTVELELDMGFTEDFSYCVHCERLWRWTTFNYQGMRQFVGYVRIVRGQMQHADYLRLKEFLKSIGKE